MDPRESLLLAVLPPPEPLLPLPVPPRNRPMVLWPQPRGIAINRRVRPNGRAAGRAAILPNLLFHL